MISDMRKNLKSAVSALVLVAGVSTFAAPARAAEDESVPVDTKIMRSIMEGLGLKRDGEAGINYQQRAPLVIPNGKALPPPEQTTPAAMNPSWPVDPDVERARREAKAAREDTGNPDDVILREGRPMRPDELTPGAKSQRTRRAPSQNASYETMPDGYSKQLSPSELGSKGNIFSNMFGKKDDEVGKFTGEPPRASLTEPPRGYQTPSPDQPYGAGKDKSLTPKPGNYLTDHPVGVD
ncbi:MAG TPA: hypothetical protein VGM57_17980 [Pseudolabrys sp.]